MIMAPAPNQDDSMYRVLARDADNFEYKGFLPFHETQKYFFRARVFVCTSDREGFPNVFLQAWQAECPVVSLTIDPDGVIEKQDIGRVSRDLDTMTADVDRLMTDDALRDQIASNGIAYIEEHHAIKSVVDQYEALFEGAETR
jgi:glycosyltransferase involved in cell wall biosynthesis